MNATFGLGLSSALLLSSLTAQTATPAKIIPAAPLAIVHVDGPAALRAAFLPTNMGKMFAGPEFKQLAAPLLEMLEMVRQRGGELPFDFAALEKGILNYRGRLSLSLHMHGRKVDPRGPEETPWTLAIVLTPDGSTNLKSFAEQSVMMMQGMILQPVDGPAPVQKFKVGEREYPAIVQDGEPTY